MRPNEVVRKAVPALLFTVCFASAPVLQAEALTFNVTCNANVVGSVTVNANGTGISGGFTSNTPAPPNNTLAAAAAACGETSFNWYQIVTATNGSYSNAGGTALTPPFVDPPLNGLQGDPTWADNLPWYWDQYAPPAGTAGYDSSYQVTSQTTTTTLNFSDFPGGPAGRTVSFSTWLVSLNSNGSFQAFDGGFSWDWTQGTGVNNIAAVVGNPTAAQYQNIIGGFATMVPEPSALLVLATGVFAMLGIARRRR